MNLVHFKTLTGLIIFFTTVTAGTVGLLLSRRYHKVRQLGDAVANGIFLGAAIFHLLPHAVHSFKHFGNQNPIITTMLILTISYFLLLVIERGIQQVSVRLRQQSEAWLLLLVLSIHALIAGAALGLAQELAIASIVFLAIIAHKGFESFALVMNLQRRIKRRSEIAGILLLFALVTPLGILFGELSDKLLEAHLDHIMIAVFNAIAAGTFFYIGTVHTHRRAEHVVLDSYRQYAQIIATLCGVLTMGILAIWV